MQHRSHLIRRLIVTMHLSNTEKLQYLLAHGPHLRFDNPDILSYF